MERKIVFFDLDGTLLGEDKQISPEVKQAVQQLKDNGVVVAIATGRAPFMFTRFQRELGIDLLVSFNGQYVVCGEKIVFKNPLNDEELSLLEQRAGTNGHPMVFLGASEMKANLGGHQHIAKSLADLKADYPPVDPGFRFKSDIYQALLFCRLSEESLYKGGITNFQLVRWHELSLDVIPPGGSKATGIERLLDYLGMRREDSYAFGDGLNDVEMLEFAGTGVAMGNACDEAKKAANYVTKGVSENGVVHGLNALGLLE